MAKLISSTLFHRHNFKIIFSPFQFFIMSQGLYGSLCLEDIFEGMIGRGQDGSMWVNISQCTQGPFNVSQKNGKHYVNIVEWIHDEPDQHGQNAGIHLSMPKGAKEQGIKPKYIGNMRYMQQQQSQAPYNPNPQYGAPQYQQPAQNWGQQPGAGPSGFQAPGFQQRPAGPTPPPPPNYGQQPGGFPGYGQQPQMSPTQQPYPQQQVPQQGFPQQQAPPPAGPQQVTQQMIKDGNIPGQQIPPPQGAWTPAVNQGGLPF